MFHFVSRFTTKFMSDVREDFLKMWNVGSRYEEDVSLPSTDSEFSTMNATSLLDTLKFEDPGSFLVTTTLLVLSFLSASFATLDNSTLRLDLTLSLHVESLATGFLYFSNHIDRVLRVSPDGWMHLDSIESQKLLQSSKPDFCHNSLYSVSLLHPVRHRFWAAGRAEILRAANWPEMADVTQMEKIVPLITCEIALCQYVCELVLVSTFLIWIFWSKSKLILSNNQSRATLWVLDTCLVVGLLPSLIIWKVSLFDFEIENSSRNRSVQTLRAVSATLRSSLENLNDANRAVSNRLQNKTTASLSSKM